MLLKRKDITKVIHPQTAIIIAIMMVHLVFAFFLQSHAVIDGDGIFTYTLANNPYSFEYIDPAYKRIPQNNGWISAHILRESYIVEEYDRFNYSSVYFHQRIDNHPLLYYTVVHTICSLFPGIYSKFFTMIINLLFLCAIDILLIRLFKKVFGNVIYTAVPFTFLFFMLILQKLYILPRMYLMLVFFCVWYLYLHWGFIVNADSAGKWKKSWLIKMIMCIFLGTQTHYYFYVYAAMLTLLSLGYLIYKGQKYKIINYIYSGIIGIAASWILFPWIIWHIFFNQMQKHTEITFWGREKLVDYISFLNERLFNGRGIAAIFLLFIIILAGIISKNKQRERTSTDSHGAYIKIAFGSSILFSVIIFTMDESVWYYSSPFYLIFAICFSILLIDLFKKVIVSKKQDVIITLLSVSCLALILNIPATVEFITDSLQRDKVNTEFNSIAENYKQYDCLFVEQGQDNLLQGYWFEFGEYDEFKKISAEDFEENGIGEEVLKGRNTQSGLLIYAPIDCCFDEEEYTLLSSNSKYNILKRNCEVVR